MGTTGDLIGPARAQASDRSTLNCGHGEPDARQRARPVRRAERGNELTERPASRLAPTLLAPLDPTGSQLLFRVVAAAYERRSLAVASHFPFEEWSRFLP
jgi:hypothetical protein